jgi:uncharacterized membrane protein
MFPLAPAEFLLSFFTAGGWTTGILPAFIFATLGIGCLGTVFAIHRRKLFLISLAASMAWLIGIAFVVMIIAGLIWPDADDVGGTGNGMFVALVFAVFLVILICIFTLAWSLTQIAAMIRRTGRHLTQSNNLS